MQIPPERKPILSGTSKNKPGEKDHQIDSVWIQFANELGTLIGRELAKQGSSDQREPVQKPGR